MNVKLLDVPAGVTQEEGHTGFLIRLPSAVLALISFIANRIQPSLPLIDREVYRILCTYELIVLHMLGMFLKKNLNAPRPSEHPPVWGKKCQNVLCFVRKSPSTCHVCLHRDSNPRPSVRRFRGHQLNHLKKCVCVCVVCVFFPFILDIKFIGRTSRGHTGGRSHRIFHPSFCGACLNFSREKDSAIPFPRRP